MAHRGAVPARPEEGGSLAHLADAALELEEALEDAPRVLPVAEEPIPLERGSRQQAAGGRKKCAAAIPSRRQLTAFSLVAPNMWSRIGNPLQAGPSTKKSACRHGRPAASAG